MIIYLYEKQHKITGLKYFGKTIKDPYKYFGSGKYWMKHIKKYGSEHIATLNVWTFEDQEECTAFALKFSLDNNIVESNDWANLKAEDALTGGGNFSESSKRLVGKASKEIWASYSKEERERRIQKSRKPRTVPRSDVHRKKLSDANKGKQTWMGRTHSRASKEKMRLSHIGKSSPKRGIPNDKARRTKFYNNGEIQRMLLEDEVPSGWIKGRLNKPWNKKS